MTDKQNSIQSRRTPHHRNKHLHSWNHGIREIIKFMKEKRGIFLTRKKVFEIIELFFELSFQAQMRGYYDVWPEYDKRMELHIIKQVGPLKIQKNMATKKIIYPDKYPGMEFVIEPMGYTFINYGYTFVPDLEVQRAAVDFINKNPEIAEKIIP